MTCTLRRLPVTDFLSDHPHYEMSDNESRSPHRRIETFPIRSNTSKEDLELAHQLVGHAQGLRNPPTQESQTLGDSPSTQYESETSIARTPPSDRMGQPFPRSPSVDQGQVENVDTYAPPIPQSDSIPSGQVCRSVTLIFS
jgi:hypothetical protein